MRKDNKFSRPELVPEQGQIILHAVANQFCLFSATFNNLLIDATATLHLTENYNLTRGGHLMTTNSVSTHTRNN